MYKAAGSAKEPPLVATIGCGHWGKNIARNFARLGALHSICDPNFVAANKVSSDHGVPISTLNEVLLDSRCDGIALASPAALHGEQVRSALWAGKHVFVEKPLALSLSEGEELADLARQRSRVLMVGHLLQYHPHIMHLLEMVRSGRLGEIRRISANRLSPGRLRSEEDVMWSFAPHDLSVILAIAGEMPRTVHADGSAILNSRVLDIASIQMKFSSGIAAQVYVSWISPFKEQKLTVIGSKATAVFDDRAAWNDKLLVFDHEIVYRDSRPWLLKTCAERFDLEEREPLREECLHFLDSIESGKSPRTDSAEALRVLNVLDAAVRSHKKGGVVELFGSHRKLPARRQIRQGRQVRELLVPRALNG